MSDEHGQHDRREQPDEKARPAAGRQSDPNSVVRKGGIASSDADMADISRDTDTAPIGEGGTGTIEDTDAPPDLRTGRAAQADAALTEALEEAKADEKGGAGGKERGSKGTGR